MFLRSRPRKGAAFLCRHLWRLLDNAAEVVAVGALLQPVCLAQHVVRGHEPEKKSDFLGTCNLQPLPELDLFDEIGGSEKRFLSPRVEPGMSTAELLDGERAELQVTAVQIGDLELATCRRLQ